MWTIITTWIQSKLISLAAIGAIIVVIAAIWITHRLDEAETQDQLNSQKSVDQRACDKAQEITKGANDALQKDRDVINQRLNAMLVRPAACVPIRQVTHMARSGKQLSGSAGLSSGWLYGYAADCEKARTTALTCEKFVNDERQP